jgi:hypothetical protein
MVDLLGRQEPQHPRRRVRHGLVEAQLAAGPQGRPVHLLPGNPGSARARRRRNFTGVSYKILADVEIADPSAPGIILAEGSRFAGHALFLKDRKLHYVYNFLGLKPEQHIESEPLEPGECVLGVEFVKEGHGEHGEPTGTAKLYVNEDVVAEEPLRTVPAHFSLTGEGLSIGRDTGDSVSEQYTPFFPFEGGRIVKVEVSIGEDAYVDLERQLMAALARD